MPVELTEVRIDKYLWSVRLYKTRSLATDACKSGRISINNVVVKPSRDIRVGEIISIRIPPITKTIKVKALLEKRVGAQLVVNYMEDITSPDELKKLENLKQNQTIVRDRGTGRPTKKERRDIDEYFDFD